MNTSIAIPEILEETRRPMLRWLLYFLVSVGVVGSLFLAVSTPILLVGLWFRPIGRVGDRWFRWGVGRLLAIQPWLNAEYGMLHYSPADAGDRTHAGAAGVLYVSNHRSTLDVYFLLAGIRGIRILAKRELLFVPFLGEIMLLRRQIFSRRADPADFIRALGVVERGLIAGDHVHIFPELTRCTPGFRGLQKFSLAPFHLAYRTGAMVVPIAFRNTDQIWPKGTYGIMPAADASVRALPAFDPRDFSSARELMQATELAILGAVA